MRSYDKFEILCGQGGLNASKSPDLVRDIDLVDMESLTFEQDTWQKDGGATKFNSSALTGTDPEIRAMIHYRQQGGTEELVCATRDNRVVVIGAGGLTKTVYTAAGGNFIHASFVEGYNGVTKSIYHFNGAISLPRVYYGGTTMFQLGSSVGNFTANSATDVLTLTAHGLTNDTVVFVTNSGGALPSGLFNDGYYYIANVTANTFQLSTLPSGAGIVNFTTNGTGTQTVHRLTMPVDFIAVGWNVRWGFQHRGRMLCGGSTGRPHGVYSSVLNNHSDYINTGSVYFEVYPGEGDLIVGGISWRNKAYLFKFPHGLYVLNDASTDIAEWGWERVSRYVGAIGQGSIVEADDEVYFVSPDGYIHALSAVQEHGDVQSSAIKAMEIGPYIRANTDFSKLATGVWTSFPRYPQPQAVYYPTKKKLLFAFSANPNVLSSQGFPVNKVLVGIDLHRSNPGGGMREYQPFVSTRDQYESWAIYRDPTTAEASLLAGASNGFIYKLDQSARSKDSAGYMASFETKAFRPYSNDQNANMKELEVVFADGSSSNSVVIKVYLNGTLATTKTLTDSDRFMRLYGDAITVKIVGENDTINSSFSIAKIIVRFKPGNWRKHQ